MSISQKGTEPTLDDDVNLSELAKLTESYTGADLAGLVQQAARQSLKDSLANEDISDKNKDEEEKVLKVNKKHFSLALQNLRPSISKEVRTFKSDFYLKKKGKYVRKILTNKQIIPGQNQI